MKESSPESQLAYKNLLEISDNICKALESNKEQLVHMLSLLTTFVERFLQQNNIRFTPANQSFNNVNYFDEDTIPGSVPFSARWFISKYSEHLDVLHKYITRAGKEEDFDDALSLYLNTDEGKTIESYCKRA